MKLKKLFKTATTPSYYCSLIFGFGHLKGGFLYTKFFRFFTEIFYFVFAAKSTTYNGQNLDLRPLYKDSMGLVNIMKLSPQKVSFGGIWNTKIYAKTVLDSSLIMIKRTVFKDCVSWKELLIHFPIWCLELFSSLYSCTEAGLLSTSTKSIKTSQMLTVLEIIFVWQEIHMFYICHKNFSSVGLEKNYFSGFPKTMTIPIQPFFLY